MATYQKVGTFVLMNGRKVGGNVAAYFTLADGKVLHVVAGPVDAETLLEEARWVIETRKLAILESKGNANKYKEIFRKAHAERLHADYGINGQRLGGLNNATAFTPFSPLFQKNLAANKGRHQAQIHYLMYSQPLADIKQIYPIVFEKILYQHVSGKPVAEVDTRPK